MSGSSWATERRMIDGATTVAVREAWRTPDALTPAQVCEVARDLFEQYGDKPTRDQMRRLAETLAQIQPIWLRHQASYSTMYRVLDIMTRAQFWRQHPEEPFNTAGTRPDGSSLAGLDPRDCDEVWTLIGPRGGTSMLHRNAPDSATQIAHVVGKKRLWYTLVDAWQAEWIRL